MNNKNDLRSPIAKAKGSGPAGSGSITWLMQRISAIALLPLVIWFVIFMLKAVKYQNSDELMSVFTSPFPTILFALFVSVGLYHGNLGIKEIIEDYVHSHSIKFSLIIFIKFLSFASVVAAICALIVYHLSTFSFN